MPPRTGGAGIAGAGSAGRADSAGHAGSAGGTGGAAGADSAGRAGRAGGTGRVGGASRVGGADSAGRAGRADGAGRADADRGAVTVEAALALCSLAVFLVLAVGAVAAVVGTIRCVDASRELARLAARGEPERGREVAAALAPAGARLELVAGGDTVVATASAELIHPLPLRISGRAVAALEPGVAPP